MTNHPVPVATTLPSELARLPRAATVAAAFADLVAVVEARLAEARDDQVALVLLGELRLRAGRAREARDLLQRACMQPPSSWEAYQRTSALLRLAEAHAAHAFDRPAGAGIPGLPRLARALRRFVSARRGWIA